MERLSLIALLVTGEIKVLLVTSRSNIINVGFIIHVRSKLNEQNVHLQRCSYRVVVGVVVSESTHRDCPSLAYMSCSMSIIQCFIKNTVWIVIDTRETWEEYAKNQTQKSATTDVSMIPGKRATCTCIHRINANTTD